jgi:hypothetical protein
MAVPAPTRSPQTRLACARATAKPGAMIPSPAEAPCNTLWIGPALGPVERACMLSVLRQGHRLVLWCYQQPEGVPPGVALADAAELLPETSIIRHRGGSPALFSNRFRYELQRRGKGIWVDTDLYLLRRLPDQVPLMGLEDLDTINTAVLHLPADSRLLPPLLSLFEERQVPPWLPLRSRILAHGRRLGTGRVALGRMPWGVAGPHAMSALARRFGIFDQALAPEVFYPVHWTEAAWIFDPAQRLEGKVTAKTVAIHLWNQCIKDAKSRPPRPGSFLARLHAEGADSA